MNIQLNAGFSPWPVAAIALAMTILVSACATPAHVRSAPGVDISSYSTFAFMSPLGTDRSGYSSFLSKSLKNAMRTALESKGYKYSESNPQMLVNFNGSTKQRTQVDPMLTPTPGFLGYRAGMYGVWAGYAPQVDQYDEGTLIIDLIDASKKQLVWEGTTTKAFNDITHWTDEDVQKTVQKIAEEIPSASL